MTHQQTDSNAISQVFELLTEQGFDGMARAMELLLDEAMKLERSEFLGARPHQRTSSRRGYANGFKDKSVDSRVGRLEVRVPQARDLEEGLDGFYPRSLERGLRSERALRLALAEMYVQGVSTRKVRAITEQLCGFEVSSSQVSRASQLLDEELESWRTRPIGRCRYLVLDARYEKVRHGGSVIDCAVLIAAGVRDDGKRTVLGVSVSLSEAEVHWRHFLESLQERGLHGVAMITSDDHAGLRAALKARFAGVAWNRCQVHLQRNATAYLPRVEMRAPLAAELRGVFRSDTREEADAKLAALAKKYARTAPKLSSWLEESVPEGLTVLSLPAAHRRRLATTNVLERLNKEIKRRTRVATLFPNEASLLRLVSAMLMETSEDWEAGRTYLTMEDA